MESDLKKLAGKNNHHSIGDWDFSSAEWQLSTARYISPPSSLHCTLGAFNVLNNLPPVYCLPEGRLVSYIWNSYDGMMPGFIFRAQCLTGATLPMSNYRAALYGGAHWVLERLLMAVPTIIGFWPVLTDLSTWYRWRVTWWVSQTLKCEPALFVQLEREEAGEWVDYGTLEDTANMWADSEVNRVGLFIHGTWSYHDNTEIWLPD